MSPSGLDGELGWIWATLHLNGERMCKTNLTFQVQLMISIRKLRPIIVRSLSFSKELDIRLLYKIFSLKKIPYELKTNIRICNSDLAKVSNLWIRCRAWKINQGPIVKNFVCHSKKFVFYEIGNRKTLKDFE